MCFAPVGVVSACSGRCGGVRSVGRLGSRDKLAIEQRGFPPMLSSSFFSVARLRFFAFSAASIRNGRKKRGDVQRKTCEPPNLRKGKRNRGREKEREREREREMGAWVGIPLHVGVMVRVSSSSFNSVVLTLFLCNDRSKGSS